MKKEASWHIARFILLICLLIVLTCCRWRHYREATKQDFLSYYDTTPTLAYRYEYHGIKRGYHVIDYYDSGVRDFPYYQYSFRLPTKSLSECFPLHPQPAFDKSKPRGEAKYAQPWDPLYFPR